MGGFDWIIATVLIVSMLIGFIRGFIEEALSLIAWIVAFWLTFTYSVQAGEFIQQYVNIPSPLFRDWAGKVVVFILSLIAFGLMNWLIIKVFVPGKANIGDRVLGASFGAIRGVAIIVIVSLFTKLAGMTAAGWWQNSHHIAKFEPLTNALEEVVKEMFPNSGLFPEEPDTSDQASSGQTDST